MNELEQLATELGALIGVSIVPDNNQVCQLKFHKSNLSIRLELEKYKEFPTLIISAKLGVIGAPTYKERVFDTALAFNAAFSTFWHGILCYGEVSDHLYMYEKINLKLIKTEKIHEQLMQFHTYAALWFEALPKGQVPTLRELGVE